MSWRPDNWKNPILSKRANIKFNRRQGFQIFEAGADAMYEAFKSAGTHYTQQEGALGLGWVLRNPSTIVIIPDEEVENEQN